MSEEIERDDKKVELESENFPRLQETRIPKSCKSRGLFSGTDKDECGGRRSFLTDSSDKRKSPLPTFALLLQVVCLLVLTLFTPSFLILPHG